MTIVLVVAVIGMGYFGYNIYQNQLNTQSLIEKAKMLQQKAEESFQQGNSEKAQIYMDSCEYILDQIEK